MVQPGGCIHCCRSRRQRYQGLLQGLPAHQGQLGSRSVVHHLRVTAPVIFLHHALECVVGKLDGSPAGVVHQLDHVPVIVPGVRVRARARAVAGEVTVGVVGGCLPGDRGEVVGTGRIRRAVAAAAALGEIAKSISAVAAVGKRLVPDGIAAVGAGDAYQVVIEITAGLGVGGVQSVGYRELLECPVGVPRQRASTPAPVGCVSKKDLTLG
jgi:hypothetical protein